MIWVDSDGYDTLSAEYRPVLLTSVLKNTGDAVVGVGQGEHGRHVHQRARTSGTLENGGVDIAPFHDLDSRVSAELSAEIDQLRAGHHFRRRRGHLPVGPITVGKWLRIPLCNCLESRLCSACPVSP